MLWRFRVERLIQMCLSKTESRPSSSKSEGREKTRYPEQSQTAKEMWKGMKWIKRKGENVAAVKEESLFQVCNELEGRWRVPQTLQVRHAVRCPGGRVVTGLPWDAAAGVMDHQALPCWRTRMWSSVSRGHQKLFTMGKCSLLFAFRQISLAVLWHMKWRGSNNWIPWGGRIDRTQWMRERRAGWIQGF